MEIRPLVWLSEGGKMVSRRLIVKANGFMRYGGDDEHICRTILDECWNGTYFRTSTGHFESFYSRDFGWGAGPLCMLGYREKVLKTLRWALKSFEYVGRTATIITSKRRVFDAFTYAPDSLAFILHALHEAGAKELIGFFHEFLEKEVQRCHDVCWDEKRGMVRADRAFSSIKDNAMRKSSTYDNTMVGMIARYCNSFGLNNPWDGVDFEELLLEKFWTGTHFREDITPNEMVTGDANLFPYWTGVVLNKEALDKSIRAVREAGLDKPFPLKYTAAHPDNIMLTHRIIAPNYEGTTIWAHLGMLYIETVAQANRKLAKTYLDQYTSRINQHKTFLEVYHPDGTPYTAPFYVSDEGMLWAANYLMLKKLLG